MFGEINRRFNKAKRNIKENEFIVESVLEIEEVLPGSDDEYDDEIDVDSVPEDVYKEIDKKLDELISKGDYDDEEIEEMLDDDDDDDDDFDIKIEETVDECVNRWIMNEDPSYGSGESVDIQNKTGDYQEGDKTKTEIPEPDCPVKATKDMDHGEDLYDFSNDNRKPSSYQEGDHVKTTDANFETYGEAKRAMHETSITSLRAMIEDASYGSGERVEVQNKTNDYLEGDHVKTEEPDFETTSEARKDFNKGEDLYDFDQGSGAGLGYSEGDHVDMETKNPITNESALSIYRSLVEGAIDPYTAQEMLDEGAVIQKWATYFSSDWKNITKAIKAAKKAKKAGDTKALKQYKAEAKKAIATVEKKAKDIPDDTWASWAGRIALSIGTAALALGPGVNAAVKVSKASRTAGTAVASLSGGVAGGAIASPLGDFVNAKVNGKPLSNVSRNNVMESLKALKSQVDNL